MEYLSLLLPIIIYFLLIILIVIGIILIIRCIRTLDKVDKVVDDINEKVQSLNGFFSLIDFTTDKIVSITDRIVDGIAFLGSKLFFKSSKKKGKDEEDE